MRVVTDEASLAASWRDAAQEAQLSFGMPDIFAERLITGARHVEVQIAGDGASAVSLGTRDCSLQRRHQKLVETAPAARHPLLEAAARGMAELLSYRGLGTWEFLTLGRAFWFMEVNPRLQVEHTVTEAVTGLDLAAIQLRLADGATLAQLGLTDPPAPRGVAIQLRINAEILTPEGSVVPQAGRITRFQPPAGPGIRVDHALADGMEANPAYDSLLAKLIVHGPDRATARRRAVAALAECVIDGVQTNLGMLNRLLSRPEFEADSIDTRFLERIAAEIAEPTARAANDATIIAAPMAGLLVSVDVTAGAAVRAGQRIALIEAMKMQMDVTAAHAGIVTSIAARAGETIRAGQILAILDPVDDTGPDTGIAPAADAGPRADLAALQARLHATQDEGRPEAVTRRHAANSRTARENLADLFDAGVYAEYGALAVAAQRRRRSMEELIRISPADGLIAGIGTVTTRRPRPWPTTIRSWPARRAFSTTRRRTGCSVSSTATGSHWCCSRKAAAAGQAIPTSWAWRGSTLPPSRRSPVAAAPPRWSASRTAIVSPAMPRCSAAVTSSSPHATARSAWAAPP